MDDKSTGGIIPLASGGKETQVYTKRYYVLLVFIALSASNSLQWIEFSIIAHIIVKFYSVSYSTVDWTSMIYMLSYIVFVLPASWVLNKYGLRVSLLLAASGNCIGAWVKTLSAEPDAFWVTFIGQTIVGSSQIFILGVPPRLAAVWFGPEQVSTACGAGVFGNQLGLAIGFLMPPLLVRMGSLDRVATNLLCLYLISAIANTIILLVIAFTIPKQPPLPPSLAQLKVLENASNTDYFQSLKELVTNINFLLLFITYGLNVGAFYAVSTLLNQMILHYHPNAQESAGTVGLLIVVAGMVGSIICSFTLDKFHQYKWTTVIVYLFTALGMIAFTFTVRLSAIWYVFMTATFLGFFMTAYLPIGFEFAAEITFPIPEGTSSGLLNGSAQVCGIALTIGVGYLIQYYSVLSCNITLSTTLLIGAAVTALIKNDLRRQKAHQPVPYTISVEMRAANN